MGGTDYVAAGVMTAPTYLKWALLFEEPDNRTVWLAKALPRDWLAIGVEPVKVSNATSRYGRVSYTMQASSRGGITGGGGGYTVAAKVELPRTYASAPPPGGVRLRIRAPVGHAGKMQAVTVGGKPWASFDAKAETVDFAAAKLTPDTLKGMQTIVVTFK